MGKDANQLSADCALADNHRLAADPNFLENSCTTGERNVNTAGATHPDPLKAHEPRGRAGWNSLVMEEIGAQRSACAAGGGILRNTDAGREHATVHRGAILGRLGREYENRVLFEVHRAE